MKLEMPERPSKEAMQAIFDAWDFYKKPHGEVCMGTPEATRIYQALRGVLIGESNG